MRLIGYIRCSDDDQGERHSVENQDAMLRNYCDLYEHDLVDVIVDDGVSGGVPFMNRPGGGQVCELLREGGADGFVCRDLDRAFRDVRDGIDINEWLDKGGRSMHFVAEKIDTSDPDGEVMFILKLAMAQRERRKASIRSSQVSGMLKEQGRVYGATPWGCVVVDGLLFRDRGIWATRDRVVRMRTERDLSYGRIAALLQAEGLPSPSGGKLWHTSTIKGLVGAHHTYEHIPFLDEVAETEDSSAGGVGARGEGEVELQ